MRSGSHFFRGLSYPLSQLLNAMVAKLGNREDPLPQDSFEGVDENEWVSVAWPISPANSTVLLGVLRIPSLPRPSKLCFLVSHPRTSTCEARLPTAATATSLNHLRPLHTLYLCKLNSAALALAHTSSPEALGFMQASGTSTAAGLRCSSRDCLLLCHLGPAVYPQRPVSMRHHWVGGRCQ